MERGMSAGVFNEPIKRRQDKNSQFLISAQQLDGAKRAD
jgi:hypothetical protein